MGSLSAAELAQVFSNLAGATAGSQMTQQRAMASNQATQAALAKQYQEELEEAQKDAERKGTMSKIGGIVGGIAGTFVAPGIGTAIGAGLGSAAGSAMGGGSAGESAMTGLETGASTYASNMGGMAGKGAIANTTPEGANVDNPVRDQGGPVPQGMGGGGAKMAPQQQAVPQQQVAGGGPMAAGGPAMLAAQMIPYMQMQAAGGYPGGSASDPYARPNDQYSVATDTTYGTQSPQPQQAPPQTPLASDLVELARPQQGQSGPPAGIPRAVTGQALPPEAFGLQLSDPTAQVINTPEQANAAFGQEKATPPSQQPQTQGSGQMGPVIPEGPRQEAQQALVNGLATIPSQAISTAINQAASTALGPQVVQTQFGPATEIGNGLAVLSNGMVVSAEQNPMMEGRPGWTDEAQAPSKKERALEYLMNATAKTGFQGEVTRTDIPSAPQGLDPRTAAAIAAPYREENIKAADAAREMDMFNKQMDMEERGLDIKEEGQNIEAGQRGAQLVNENANAVADRALRAAGYAQEAADASADRELRGRQLEISDRTASATEMNANTNRRQLQVMQEQTDREVKSKEEAVQMVGKYRSQGADIGDIPIEYIIKTESRELLAGWLYANGLVKSGSGFDMSSFFGEPGVAPTDENVSGQQMDDVLRSK